MSQRLPAVVDLGAAGRQASGQRIAIPAERQRDVAVADEHERRSRFENADQRDLLGEDVVPHRIARTAVEELDAGSLGERLEAA